MCEDEAKIVNRIFEMYASGVIGRNIIKSLTEEGILLVMIRLLVNKIVLYDDKVEVYYNCIDRRRPDDLVHQAFCIYTEEFDVDLQEYGFIVQIRVTHCDQNLCILLVY